MSPKTAFDARSKLQDLLECVFDDKTIENLWEQHFGRDRIQEKIKYMKNIMLSIFHAQNELKIEFSKIKKLLGSNHRIKESNLQECLNNWTIQLKLCTESVEWLQNHGFYNYLFYGHKDFDKTFKKLFLDKIGRVKRRKLILGANFSFGGKIVEMPVQVLPKFTIGKGGEKPGELCRPWGVSTDFLNRIFVADRSNHRIQVFSECGEYIMTVGEKGSKPGQLCCPSGVTVDNDKRIIVADKDNHRIQIFASDGAFLTGFGSMGTRAGEFNYPWDVAVNDSNEIAVSDSKNHRVQLFDRNGKFLKLFGFFGFKRPDLNLLNMPKGLVFRPDGKLLVADFNNHVILLLDKNFQLIRKYGKNGSAPGCFFRPQSVTCFENESFAVSDCKNYRIQVLNSKGQVLECFGNKGTQKGELDCPQGLAYNLNGDLLVVDFGNNRIQVF